MKRTVAGRGSRFEPADHCRPAKPSRRPSAQTPARPNSDNGPKTARKRSRRRSVRNIAAARLQRFHVKPKYRRVNRRRRLTVRGRTTVSKASHRTVVMTKVLRRKASRCTPTTTLRSGGLVKGHFFATAANNPRSTLRPWGRLELLNVECGPSNLQYPSCHPFEECSA